MCTTSELNERTETNIMRICSAALTESNSPCHGCDRYQAVASCCHGLGWPWCGRPCRLRHRALLVEPHRALRPHSRLRRQRRFPSLFIMSSTASTSASASGSQTTSASGGSQSATASNSSSVSIPKTAAAGGITITQPAQTSTAFFKIASGQPITFAWNFTSLYVTPTSLTVSAICDNGITYPVGPTDGVIPGTATSVVWDVYDFQQSNPNSPLAQATYTLEVFDSRGAGAAQSAGLFSPNNNLKFALYTPQPYTPIASGTFSHSCRSAATCVFY